MQSQPVPQSNEEYKAAIIKIRRNVVDLTSANDLFGITNFVSLYENGTIYTTNAVVFLEDASNADEEKMIVVYSLQKLPLDEYLTFERGLLKMANEHRISKTLFNRALFPGLEWSTKIQCGFAQENVKRLLAELAQSSSVNDVNKTYIKDILSGRECEKIKEFRESGMIPNRTN